MSKLTKIPLDLIDPCPFIPDREDLGDLDSLVASMKIKNDVDVALKVRTNPDVKGRYQRVYGKRRLDAAKALGLKEVSCIVEFISDEEAFRQHAIENIHRKDKNPIEEADFFDAWSKHCNLTFREIAAELGKPEEYVYNRTILLGLPSSVKNKILSAKNFGIYHGLLLLQVKDPAVQEKLADEVVEKSLTVRELEKKIRELEPEAEPAEEERNEDSVPEEPLERMEIERPKEMLQKVREATERLEQLEEKKPKPEEAEGIVKEAIHYGKETKPYDDLVKEVEALRSKLEEVEAFLQRINDVYDLYCPSCHKLIVAKTTPDLEKGRLKIELMAA